MYFGHVSKMIEEEIKAMQEEIKKELENKELTLKQVLEVIKPGEEYESTDDRFRLKAVSRAKFGDIVFHFVEGDFYEEGALCIGLDQKFKKKENLIKAKIATVEYFPGSLPVKVLIFDDTAAYDMIKFRKSGDRARYGMVLEVEEVMLKKEDFKDRYYKEDNKVKEDNGIITCYTSMVEDREGGDPFEVLNPTMQPVGSICECFTKCGESMSYVRIISTNVKSIERKVYNAMYYI